MKRQWTLLLCLALALCLAGCSLGGKRKTQPSVPQPAQLPAEETPALDASTPTGAAVLLMEAVKTMDVEEIRKYVSDADSFQLPASAQVEWGLTLARTLSRRMEYTVTYEVINGNYAAVQMRVASPNLGGLMDKAVTEGIKYAAGQALRGKEVDYEAFLLDYVDRIDLDALDTVETTTAVYLIRQGDNWVLDRNNPENKQFADALTGGALSKLEQYGDMAELLVD